MAATHHNHESGTLEVRVVKGMNLLPMDRGKTSDPYVTVSIPSAGLSVTSPKLKKTLNPEWGFAPPPLGPFVDAPIVSFSVLDWDRLDADDAMGSASLDLATLPSDPPEWTQITLDLDPPLDSDATSAGSLLLELRLTPSEEGVYPAHSLPHATTGRVTAPSATAAPDSLCVLLPREDDAPPLIPDGAPPGLAAFVLPAEARVDALACLVDAAFKVGYVPGPGASASEEVFAAVPFVPLPVPHVDDACVSLALEVSSKSRIVFSSSVVSSLALPALIMGALRAVGLTPKGEFPEEAPYTVSFKSVNFTSLDDGPAALVKLIEAMESLGFVLELAVGGHSAFVFRPFDAILHPIDPLAADDPTIAHLQGLDLSIAGPVDNGTWAALRSNFSARATLKDDPDQDSRSIQAVPKGKPPPDTQLASFRSQAFSTVSAVADIDVSIPNPSSIHPEDHESLPLSLPHGWTVSTASSSSKPLFTFAPCAFLHA